MPAQRYHRLTSCLSAREFVGFPEIAPFEPKYLFAAKVCTVTYYQ